MATVSPTRVHTPLNDADRVDIADGFPLFHASEDTTGHTLSGSRSATLINVEPLIAGMKFHLVFGTGISWGIVGPSYAVDISVAGSADEQSITLVGSESRAVAGLEMGFPVRFFLTLDMYRWAGLEGHWVKDAYWYHVQWDDVWASVGRFNVDVSIDLIRMLATWLAGKFKIDVGKGLPATAVSAVVATTGNELATEGKVSLRPDFWYLIDVAAAVPGLKTVKDTVGKLGGDLQVGPTLSLSLPTTISIVEAATEGTRYSLTASDGQLTGSPLGPSEVGAGTIALTFSHTAGVALSVGVGISVTFFKLFSKAAKIDWDLLSLLGMPQVFGPYEHAVTGAPASYAFTPEALDSSAAYDVVLDEPALVGA